MPLGEEGAEMVAQAWILKMGNQVSSNLKSALLLEPSKKRNPKSPDAKQVLGILSFEVANVMSKTIHLHKSLTDSEILKLKNEISVSEGVKSLVSSDENYLLELALAEKLHDLNRVASVISRLGKKCSEPALQGFEHVYADIMGGVINVKELGFLVKDMDGMVRKMERYVQATSNLYGELEVLNELEQATKKFQQNQHEESRKAFEQKVIWQRQDVGHLKDISLWNQTYDKVVELLARSLCTIYARICLVFGDSSLKENLQLLAGGSPSLRDGSGLTSCQVDVNPSVHMVSELPKRALSSKSRKGCPSGLIGGAVGERRRTKHKPSPGHDSHRGDVQIFRPGDFNIPCGASPGRLFLECLSLSSSVSKWDDDVDPDDRSSQVSGCYSNGNGNAKREHLNYSGSTKRTLNSVPLNGDQRQVRPGMASSSLLGPKNSLTIFAPPSTVGGSALALHYANVIIIIEKLLRYPHLVGEEARNDLYQMLPMSLRMSLRTNLKAYVKNLAIYDAPLAHYWKETLDGILRWLAPLAHNMIRWQSERNFEQQQIVARTNVLLLQTLYFADRGKTEAAICKLLVGLNYICRYEHQQNALLDCASSFDFDDCMEWRLQY